MPTVIASAPSEWSCVTPRAALEAEFAERTQKILTRRQQIVEGDDKPTDAEVEAWASQVGNIHNDLPDPSVAMNPSGIPYFWPAALRTWLMTTAVDGLTVTSADWEVLDYLREVRVAPWHPPEDFMMRLAMGGESMDMPEGLEAGVDALGGMQVSWHHPYCSLRADVVAGRAADISQEIQHSGAVTAHAVVPSFGWRRSSPLRPLAS